MNNTSQNYPLRITVASDHAGIEMKERVVLHLKKKYQVNDWGTHGPERVDYPDMVDGAVDYFRKHNEDFLILICGTGIGMSMAANKKQGILCALVNSVYTAIMARQHNHANCLALPARVETLDPVEEILDSFFETEPESGRHQERVKKISVENFQMKDK